MSNVRINIFVIYIYIYPVTTKHHLNSLQGPIYIYIYSYMSQFTIFQPGIPQRDFVFIALHWDGRPTSISLMIPEVVRLVG